MSRKGQTGNTKLVKKINRKGILYHIKENGPLSRADLAKRTGLSRPCVSSIIEEMLDEGLVNEIGEGISKGGRRPILLQYNARAFCIIGAILEENRFYMTLADSVGEPIAEDCIEFSQSMDKQMIITLIDNTVSNLLQKSGMMRRQLRGLGFGLPGITQKESGVLTYAPSLPCISWPSQQEFEQCFGVPVVIDNDVNMMTKGEYHRGAGQGASSLAYFYVGTGIGAGIILQGQFVRGSHEAAGEIGCMVIGPVDGERQAGYGIFEYHYALPGIRRRTGREWSDLLVAARNGDTYAQECVDDIYQHWTYGIANFTSVLNPERIILGGALAKLNSTAVEYMRSLLAKWVPVVPELVSAHLGEKAGIDGAIYSVLETLSAGEQVFTI
jgi:predicted NBD/HSP70 family sugar kinase